MKKKQVCTILALFTLMVSARSEAISLESRAIIDEIRSRLMITEAQEVAVEAPIVDEAVEHYVPGQELANALQRLRKRIYKKSENQPRLAFTPKSMVTTEQYEPGKLLAQSLEKIRSQREIFRLIKLIRVVETANNIPGMPVFTAKNLDQTDHAFEENIEIEAVEELREAVEPTANSSASLLRVADLKTDRHLTHTGPAATEKTKVAAEPIKFKRQDEEEADSQLNETISKFEYKMPKNYRIIVR